jgi:gluconate 2-dehydrogenase alpha chain
MATDLRKTDVVIVGTGAAGGIAAFPLARSGAKVIALEAGGRHTERDYQADEIRHDTHNWLGRAKANWEVPTVRATPDGVAEKGQGIIMMNGVGGSSIHYTGQSWRLHPYNFREHSTVVRRYGAGAIPPGVALADWPVQYEELEHYYDRVERAIGISGKAGNIRGRRDARGNVLEGERRREYPMPPLRSTGWTELLEKAAHDLRWNPFPGPAAILSRTYRGRPACDYHGYCTFNGCHIGAKSSVNVTTLADAEETGNLRIVTRARVVKINTDGEGRATGVTYVRGKQEFFQPADVVLLGTYTYENARLMFLSSSPAHPNGLGNSSDQLGRHYMAHTYLSVSGLFPGQRLNLFSGTGAQQIALDDFDGDNFDHTGLGFIGGATLSSGMETKPISMARNTPPNLPQWGSAWKQWLRANANSVGGTLWQMATLPYEHNRLDLDPTHKDQYGQPVIRITFRLGDNELRQAEFAREKATQWLKTAGAAETWGGDPFPLALNSHAYGGTGWGPTRRRASSTGGARSTTRRACS